MKTNQAYFGLEPRGGGLNKLVPSGSDGSPPTFMHYKNDPSDPNSLSSNFVWSIYEDQTGVLWVGTREGLNKLIPSDSEVSPPTFTHYKKTTRMTPIA